MDGIGSDPVTPHRPLNPRKLALSTALGAALLACNRSEPPQPMPSSTPTVNVRPSGPEVQGERAPSLDRDGLLSVDEPALVGRLVANERYSVMHPSEYCLDDGWVYAGAPARIGRLNVFTSSAIDTLSGRLVLARGRHEPSLLALLDKREQCPSDYGKSPAEFPQMRSDWVAPEGGFKTARDKLAKLPCFRARELRAVDLGEKLEARDDVVVVELRNPFLTPLDALEARAHYEGGPGKPMPLFREVKLALPAGGTQRLELPAHIEAGPAGQDAGARRGSYRLHSVDLRGTLGKTDFDASLYVGR